MAGRVSRRLLQRRSIDGVIDWARFRLDTFPRSGPLRRLSLAGYQPLPWLGLDDGDRTEGTLSRWLAIRSVLAGLSGLETAVDIGANRGFFAIGLAELGLHTVAVERYPVAYRTALYASRKAGVAERVAVLTLDVDSESVALLPHADVVLFLSVWHHVVLRDGLDGASGQLREIWARTGRVLFFEAGDDGTESDPSWPSMAPDPRAWLLQYLSETCAGGDIRHLGEHPTSDAKRLWSKRHLFAVVR
jgi:hypothetical protein